MILLENRVLINKSVDEVFQTVTDVAKWPEFLPSHKEMKIINQEKDNLLIEWSLGVRLKTSIFIDRTNKRMISEQLSGLVKGLRAEYVCKDQFGKTSLSLVHKFESKTPLIGKVIELVTLNSLKKMSPDTLNRVKRRLEVN